MIRWLEEESGEGRFESAFFRNDENEGELIVYADSSNPDYRECSERCVEAFNALSEADGLSDPRDILRYCWFAALYVDMAGAEDEVGYVVEGEGDWGEPVGFAVKGDRVTYVGPDYLEAMENPY